MTTDRFLVDTNVFILLFNNRLAESLPPGELACSVITEMELLSFPSMTPVEEESIREMLAGLKVYGIDEEITRKRRFVYGAPHGSVCPTQSLSRLQFATMPSC